MTHFRKIKPVSDYQFHFSNKINQHVQIVKKNYKEIMINLLHKTPFINIFGS